VPLLLFNGAKGVKSKPQPWGQSGYTILSILSIASAQASSVYDCNIDGGFGPTIRFTLTPKMTLEKMVIADSPRDNNCQSSVVHS
jgi:hypothetical protein